MTTSRPSERLHSEHLAVFKAIEDQAFWIASRKPRPWARQVGASEKVCNQLPEDRVDRAELKRICSDEKASAEQCFLAIMAWGGMKLDHGRRAWAIRESWVKIVDDLRAGRLTRVEAYGRFQQLRRDHPGCGMGPAYYTKLIFFAHPAHDGYIMDQWTSLSVNLLVESPSPLVALTSGQVRGVRYDRVTDANSAETYERFCSAIDQLAQALGLSAEQVETRMFSQGGKRPGVWRRYVRAHRPPLVRGG